MQAGGSRERLPPPVPSAHPPYVTLIERCGGVPSPTSQTHLHPPFSPPPSPTPAPSPSLCPPPPPPQSHLIFQMSSPPPKQPPRRVPPPCWTHEETLALIESYHDKWYTLRRGNLKASHWQEVADAVARRCRFATPSKTSVQCRHKIEKLRKRYRNEKQRAIATAPNRYTSSWNFFKKMDDMEKGPLSASSTPTFLDQEYDNTNNQEDDDDEDEDNDDEEDENFIDTHQNSSPAHYYRMINTNGSGSGSGGFRLRIPSGSRQTPSPLGVNASSKPKNYANYPSPNHTHNSTPTNPRYVNSGSVPIPKPGGYVRSDGSGSKIGVKRERELDPVEEMVMSIRMLGEGFVKMEQKKIEMAKEMEQMRMEMEIKRTEMILDSQQKIVEAFAKGVVAANKKVKKMPSPEL